MKKTTAEHGLFLVDPATRGVSAVRNQRVEQLRRHMLP
jgi:hypothetical protein